MHELVRVALSLIPVVLFLLSLFALDSFKLVRPSGVGRAIGAGAVAGLACFALAWWVIRTGLVGVPAYSRFLAPLVEETAKVLFVVYLVRTRRVGFMVDAAILGFATGAGFALVENLYYLGTLSEPNLLLWGVRGFGTAVLHGSTTAIAAIVSKLLADLRPSGGPEIFLPGLAIAVVAHGLFNYSQVYLSPLVFTAVLVAAFPLLVFEVFSRSERLLRRWLDVGFGSDVELLDMLRSGEVRETRVGHYLRALRDRFPGEVLADMLCYLEIMVELSIKAKGRLLMKEAGFPVPSDPVIAARLKELAFLERSIAVTGKLALSPFLHVTSRDLWQLRMLKEHA
jgi:RsiW-degrading membrane proteinase PrsW (M82 family)